MSERWRAFAAAAVTIDLKRRQVCVEHRGCRKGQVMTTAGVFEKSVRDLRGHDSSRLRYLRSLSQLQVWLPRAVRPAKHQTVTVFDWDDTLVCTSWLSSRTEQQVSSLHPTGFQRLSWLNIRKEQPLSAWHQTKLQSIEREAGLLLELAMKLGHVFIITNAMEGWIERSAAQWFPGLLPVLGRVPLISARTRFESQYPADVSKWKMCAFNEVQKQFPDTVITNLLSIGDSRFELDAARAISKKFEKAFVKTIKFKELPTPEELHTQLEIVSKQFHRIVENARSLKMELQIKPPPQSQAN